MALSIPVIDLACLQGIENSSSDEFIDLCSQIQSALSNVGFMYIKNHGIPKQTIECAFETSVEFFENTTPEQKNTVSYDLTTAHGFMKQGRETFDQSEDGIKAQMELRESFDITSISPDAIYPDKFLPSFRTHLTKIAMCSKRLAQILLRPISISMGQDEIYLLERHKRILGQNNSSILRSLYYPPLITTETAKKITRCGEHSDYGTITLLFQRHSGLEVKSKNGTWMPAYPKQDMILVNVGDLLAIMSDNCFPATRHRVRIPENEVERRTAGQSIVFFVHPDGEVECHGSIGNGYSVNAKQHLLNRLTATVNY